MRHEWPVTPAAQGHSVFHAARGCRRDACTTKYRRDKRRGAAVPAPQPTIFSYGKALGVRDPAEDYPIRYRAPGAWGPCKPARPLPSFTTLPRNCRDAFPPHLATHSHGTHIPPGGLRGAGVFARWISESPAGRGGADFDRRRRFLGRAAADSRRRAARRRGHVRHGAGLSRRASGGRAPGRRPDRHGLRRKRPAVRRRNARLFRGRRGAPGQDSPADRHRWRRPLRHQQRVRRKLVVAHGRDLLRRRHLRRRRARYPLLQRQ